MQASIDRAVYGRCAVTALAPGWVSTENILSRPKIKGDCIDPPMTAEGLGVIGVKDTYTFVDCAKENEEKNV